MRRIEPGRSYAHRLLTVRQMRRVSARGLRTRPGLSLTRNEPNRGFRTNPSHIPERTHFGPVGRADLRMRPAQALKVAHDGGER
jgi:hypothetical protein